MTNQRLLRPADVAGWDAESLLEFDRRWLRGDTIAEMCRAFNLDSGSFVCEVRARRGLPTRRGSDGRYRGGRHPVGYVGIACPVCHRGPPCRCQQRDERRSRADTT